MSRNSRLNTYLADIDRQSDELLFWLVNQMAEREGVPETLKAAGGMKWVQMMNNIRNPAAEVVYSEIIYV